MLVLPGNAGAIHSQLKIHDRSDFFCYPSHRKNNISSQGPGYAIFLVHRLIDIIGYECNIDCNGSTVPFNPAMGLDVFHMHFIAHIGCGNFLQHLFYGCSHVLCSSLRNISGFSRCNDGIGTAGINLTMDRQWLPVHLSTGSGVGDGKTNNVADRVSQGTDIFLKLFFVLYHLGGQGPFKT